MAEAALRGHGAVAERGAAGDGIVGRPLRRRRSLPGGRAVLGGFLVALAAVGIFAGYTSATADTREPYLVARRDLRLGHRISAADLVPLPMDLPGALQARSYRDPGLLIGSLVIGPVSKGELLQSSDILAGDSADGERQISFPIESARAVNGQLRRGELVDVLATYGTGADGYTVVVVLGARVADRSESKGSLSHSGDEVITLAVPAAADTLAVAHAVSAGVVTLVRAGGAGPGQRTAAPSTYTAPGASGSRAPGQG